MAGPLDAGRRIAALIGKADNAPGVIRAYHGSPHSFSRFDASKIGTGEGAQAYGHGLYFAGNEGVARSYRDIPPSALPPERLAAVEAAKAQWQEALGKWTAAEKAIADLHATRGTRAPGWGDIAAVPKGDPELARLTEEYNRWQQAMDAAVDAQNAAQFGRQRGHMYEVEIGYPEEALLDYDRKLTEQPGPVLDYARSLGYRGDMWTGEDLYGDLGRFTPEDIRPGWTSVLNTVNDRVTRPQVAAARLMEAGIPGIRYLDQGSRSAGDGTRNYVMFPGTEDRIRILRQYGLLPPLVAAGMMGEE